MAADQVFSGADDGIRTRDPHLGNVNGFVRAAGSRPRRALLYGIRPSAPSSPVQFVERSTIVSAPSLRLMKTATDTTGAGPPPSRTSPTSPPGRLPFVVANSTVVRPVWRVSSTESSWGPGCHV